MKKIFTYFFIGIISFTICTYNISLFASSDRGTDSSIYGEIDSWAEHNTGFYWANSDGTYEDATKETLDNPDAYDLNKPVMVYSHGLQWNGGYMSREEFYFGDDTPIQEGDDMAIASYWIKAGYNVLVYCWGQDDDENGLPMPYKVWCADSNLGLRWRQKDGTYTSLDDPTNFEYPLAMEYTKELVNILEDWEGEELRITGHSMGGQLTVGALNYIMHEYKNDKLNSRFVPTRVSLIDPYLGLNTLPDNDTATVYWKDEDDPFKTVNLIDLAVLSRRTIKEAYEMGIAVDYYYGSMTGMFGMSAPDVNNPDDIDFTEYATVTYVDLTAATTNTDRLHAFMRDFYFYSIGFEPQTLATMYSGYAPSASTPTSEIYANAGKKYKNIIPASKLAPTSMEFSLIYQETLGDTSFNSVATLENGAITKGVIYGYAFNDINNNGIRDNGEAFEQVDKMNASLYNTNNILVDTVEVNNYGYYEFETPISGDYYILFNGKRNPHFYQPLEATILSSTPVSNVDSEGKSTVFTVNSEYANYMVSAGFSVQSYFAIFIIIGIVGMTTFIGFIILKKRNKKIKKRC